MIRLRLAGAARDDLRDIRIYSKAAFGSRTAKGYLIGLNVVFDLLRGQPEAGALEPDLGDGIRGFSYRSHRIYYRHRDAEVVIVRILHQARDVRPALRGEG